MHFPSTMTWLFVLAAPLAAVRIRAEIRPLPSSRGSTCSTIEGENDITFAPAAGLDPSKVEYRARIEYLVKTRTGRKSKPTRQSASKKKTRSKSSADGEEGQERRRRTTNPHPPSRPRLISRSMPPRWTSFRTARRWCSRGSPGRSFQGRFMPDAPVLSVNYREAPPPLQDLLKRFDVTAASVLLDDRARVLRRQVRLQGPLHAITETLLSIHTPIPTDAAFWEAPTQLAMGHNQTAKGMLRFEKDKGSIACPAAWCA